MIQNCRQVSMKNKKNVYTLCLVFVKIEEIQRNYKIVLLSPFHGSLERHVSSKRNYMVDRFFFFFFRAPK
jgi:hypothetical protein